MNSEYTLTLRGFKTKEQVQAFIDWYEGSGEQSAGDWFEIGKQYGKIDVDFMPVDVHKDYVWEENNLTAWLRI